MTEIAGWVSTEITNQVDANKVKVKVRANKGDVLIRYSNKEIKEMDGFEQLKQLSLS